MLRHISHHADHAASSPEKAQARTSGSTDSVFMAISAALADAYSCEDWLQYHECNPPFPQGKLMVHAIVMGKPG